MLRTTMFALVLAAGVLATCVGSLCAPAEAAVSVDVHIGAPLVIAPEPVVYEPVVYEPVVVERYHHHRYYRPYARRSHAMRVQREHWNRGEHRGHGHR